MRFLSPAALVRPPVPSVAECRGEVPHFDFFFAALFFVDFLADRFVADFLVADFFAALFDVRFVADFFAADFFADFLAVFFTGTFPPARRASDSPMAIACLRLVTFLPDLPLRKVPVLRSCIAFLTFDCAFFPYFGMLFLLSMARGPGSRATPVSRPSVSVNQLLRLIKGSLADEAVSRGILWHLATRLEPNIGHLQRVTK